MDAGIHSSGGGRLEGPSGKRARLPRRRPALCRRSVPRGIPPRASAHHRARPRRPAACAPLHNQRGRRLLHPQDRVRRGLREVLSRHPRRSRQRAPVHGKRRAALARFEHRAREHELWTRVEGSPHRAARDHRLAWRRAAHRGGAAASSPGKALASLAKKGHGMIPVVLLGGLNIVRALGLVKPKMRTGWEHSSVNQRLFGGAGKARIFASGREARADPLVRQLADVLCFQEYVPGGDEAIWSFHGFAAPGGEVLEWFVGRKIRTFPALTGDSSYLRLARDEDIAALGRDIAARLRLAGIFKMDFKRSATTGRFHLLEINTRFNLWHYLGARSGVNLPRVAYDYLVRGERPLHAEASLAFRWLCLRHDWRAYRDARARNELSLAAWLASLIPGRKVYDLFAWTDPLPFLHYCMARLKRLPRRLTRLTLRFSRWLSTAS